MSNDNFSRSAEAPKWLPGPSKRRAKRTGALLVGLTVLVCFGLNHTVQAQTPSDPHLLDPNLGSTKVVDGLVAPTNMVFLPSSPAGTLDILVNEKRSGKVQWVQRPKGQKTGFIKGNVLDLAVNSSGDRGLLGIALHPDFPTNPGVYLFWTESNTGVDTFGPLNTGKVELLGHHVNRYLWNGSILTPDLNLINLRALQTDDPAKNPLPAIHVGGVLRFGQDGKLYIDVSDNGRRGWMQNLFCGPTATCPGPTVQDDQFGGPEPDNAHLTGVILRLNDDGTTPTDNPFFAAGAAVGGEVGANIQKIFAYGIRNAFGMAFDPASGNLWLAENGEDSFTELHRIEPGQNGGWVQIRGPLSRIAQYRAIETGAEPAPCNGFAGLEQDRWPGTPIAGTPPIAATAAEALSRLVMLPGAHYKDPEFSWKFEVAPAGIGFMEGRGLGPQYENDLFMGALEIDPELERGYLFHFNLTGNRRKIGVDDPKLEDRVADNTCVSPLAESENLLFGTDFGVGAQILTGPNGNLFVLSASKGAIYEIFRRH
jgi:glucose/arabinose dehydrogenase